MNKQLLKDALGWGLLLWLIGFVLGMVLFFVVPASILGWVIMPIGAVITIWVLMRKIKNHSIKYYLALSVVWTVIAIALDYVFIVKMLNPADGYYKLDVYLYYVLTFTLPLLVWYYKNKLAKA